LEDISNRVDGACLLLEHRRSKPSPMRVARGGWIARCMYYLSLYESYSDMFYRTLLLMTAICGDAVKNV
jgi:hypothetical protein